MKRAVKVTTAHRNVAVEALFRAMEDEPWHCEKCYQAAIDQVAQMLAEGKTVMLRRDENGPRIALFSK